MALVRWLLDQKGRRVWTIGPDATVYEAIESMSENNIGALVVTENGSVVGMITERLYAREVILKDRASKDTKVRDIMETKIPFVAPDNNIDQCMAIMSALTMP